jgi:hypothetical protein
LAAAGWQHPGVASEAVIDCRDVDSGEQPRDSGMPAVAATLVRQRQFVIFGVSGVNGAATA